MNLGSRTQENEFAKECQCNCEARPIERTADGSPPVAGIYAFVTPPATPSNLKEVRLASARSSRLRREPSADSTSPKSKGPRPERRQGAESSKGTRQGQGPEAACPPATRGARGEVRLATVKDRGLRREPRNDSTPPQRKGNGQEAEG